MFWYIDNIKSRMLVVPFLTAGESVTFNAQLVVEAGERFEGAFLALQSLRFAGNVLVRWLPDSEYHEVLPALDPSAWLGTLVGPREIVCEFTITADAALASGEYAVPIGFFHGGDIKAPSGMMSGADEADFPLWGEEESDSPLWNGATGQPPFWESGSMCGKKHYEYLPPSEELQKWDAVYVDTDGTTEAYRAADCVASGQTGETLPVEKTWKRAYTNAGQAEAFCVGIIDDDCVNYTHAIDGVIISDGTDIYWQGGIVDSLTTGRVWQLDRLTRLWTELSLDAAGERSQHVGFYYDGKAYIWGGKDSLGTFLNTLLAFDLTAKTWATVSTGGTARCLCGVMLVGTKAHFVGGVDSEGNVLRSVDIVDLETLAWTTGTEAPAGFASLGIESATPLRPVWQACDGILFYGGPTAGRDEQFWQYTGTGWTAPGPLADVATPGRDVGPNVPLKPVYSLPQNCARIKPYGTDGPGEWVGIPTVDGRLADLFNEDLGVFTELNIGERRALTQGFCTDDSWSLTIGKQQWLGASPGERTAMRPDAGWIQVLGEAVSAKTFCFRSQTPVFNLTRWKNSAWADDGVRYYYEFGGDDGTGVTNRLRRLDRTTWQWEELTAGCTARSLAGMGFSAGKLYVIGGIDADGVTLLNTFCIFDTWTSTWTAAAEGPYAAAYGWIVQEGPWPNGGFWQGEWALGYCYEKNAVVYRSGTFYQSKQTHLSVSTNAPGTGADWEDYWVVVTELPDIYVIGGTTDQGNQGDVWIYDPNDDSWNEGIGGGSDFTDDFNTTGADFALATDETIGENTNEDNWICSGDQVVEAGLGSIVYTIGIRHWSEGGELVNYQRAIIPFDLVTGTYGQSFDLSGDYTYSSNNPDEIGILEHVIGYDRYIYAFGQYTDNISGVAKFGAFRIDPYAETMNLVASCRAEDIGISGRDRYGCSATFDRDNNRIVFYGGHGDLAPQIDVFDLASEEFTEAVGTAGIERSNHAATIYGGLLYLYYGKGSDGYFLDSTNTIDLTTFAYSAWDVPFEFSGTGNDGANACNDDDGNLYLQGHLMYSPVDNSWSVNDNLSTASDATVAIQYYGGALYWQTCDGDATSMHKADLGAGYIPIPVTITVVRNKDGSVTVTWSTGETYTTLAIITKTGESKPSTVWTSSFDPGSGMTSFGSGSSPVVSSGTISTGASTEEGTRSVSRQYTITRYADGTSSTSMQTNYV